ncbi:MAG: NAD(P)/FAD-dependent oxidoreductase [Deltaproteobacteria bacterium]|nr:NAD(P)/FAD-dependent oxidoreductase [Deltaproteobacteria bacterium]
MGQHRIGSAYELLVPFSMESRIETSRPCPPHRGPRATPIPSPPTRTLGSRARYDAIVVGSGVGGAVTAALLAQRGRRVLLLEKNDRLGGILASFERHGFKLDAGSHLIAHGEKGTLGRVLRALGLARPRFLTHPIPVRSRGILELTAPTRRRGLARTGLELVRALRLTARERRHLARLVFQVFTLTEPELRLWDRRTLETFVRRYTDHPGVYFLLSFLASIFFVLPPWQVSAGEALRALRGVLWSYRLSYVEGGMDSLIHALLGEVVARGGELVVSRPATRVRHGGHELVVTTDDGREYAAPVVAANLAPADLLPLLDGPALPAPYVARARSSRPSGNAHQLKLGLRRPLVEEGCLIGGLTMEGLTLADLSLPLMRRTVDQIAVGRASDPLAVYAPCPTNYDPSLGPEGQQLLLVSLYGPTCEGPLDPPAVWKERGLAALARVLPGLEDELLFAELTPVPEVAAWMGKSNCGAICTGQFPDQVGSARLSVETPVPGLFLCGDGAGGRGIGTELAAASGVQAARAMLRLLGRGVRSRHG